jgi:hypothetical protein
LEEELAGKVRDLVLMCRWNTCSQLKPSLQFQWQPKVDDKWVEEWADFGDEFESLSKNIADKIKEQIKSKLNIPRYKLVTQVTIGQSKDQGVSISSRCLWDTATDNYTMASFKNQLIWASVIVFGIYTE